MDQCQSDQPCPRVQGQLMVLSATSVEGDYSYIFTVATTFMDATLSLHLNLVHVGQGQVG